MQLTLPGRHVACEAIIFDKDGTLVDLLAIDLALGRSRAAAIAALAGDAAAIAWQQAAGCDLERGWLDRDGPLCLASRQDELLVAASVLYRLGHPWDEARALARRAYERADESLEAPFGGELLPGVAELLAWLRARGLPLAIATTDRRWRTEAMLAALGLGGCFRTIVGADDVAHGKPAPDMVQLICRQLGCPPAAAVVVGDSPADLEMARAAGAAAIGVTSGLNEAARLEPLADLVLPSVTSLIDHLVADAET